MLKVIKISKTRGFIMNNNNLQERFRKLSIASLITGISAYCYAVILFTLVLPSIGNYMKERFSSGITMFGQPIYEILPLIAGFVSCFGLPIAAVVCGSIDLKRIKAGIYSKKGKVFDITGIVLSGPFILIAIWFLLGEMLIPQ
jgi:hypothetical protein